MLQALGRAGGALGSPCAAQPLTEKGSQECQHHKGQIEQEAYHGHRLQEVRGKHVFQHEEEVATLMGADLNDEPRLPRAHAMRAPSGVAQLSEPESGGGLADSDQLSKAEDQGGHNGPTGGCLACGGRGCSICNGLGTGRCFACDGQGCALCRSTDDKKHKISRSLESWNQDVMTVRNIHEIELQCAPAKPGLKRSRMNDHLDEALCKATVIRFCQAITGAPMFEWAVSFVIFVNAVVIGVQADLAVRYPGDPEHMFFRVFEYVTVAFFTIELLLRLIPSGKRFLKPGNPDAAWNAFDSLLVAAAYFEFLAAASGEPVVRTNITRLFRLSRLVRAMRIIRIVRFFSELRVMVLAIGSSLRLLLWASLLLVMLMYLFAVCFLQVLEDVVVEAAETPERAHPQIDALRYYFGSLSRGIYTLYVSITSGISWHEASEPLGSISPWLVYAYCGYIAIAVFCVLNTVTGIFVDKANHIASIDEDCRLWAEMDKRKKWIKEVQTLFARADEDGTGMLEFDEFSTQLKDIRIQEALKQLGLDVNATEPSILFELFDYDGGGTIDISEFATALMKLHGNANAVDIAALKCGLKIANDNIKSIVKMLQSGGSSSEAGQ